MCCGSQRVLDLTQMRQIWQNTRASVVLERMIAHEHARDVARAEHARSVLSDPRKGNRKDVWNASLSL
jgi:hypothetical protein